ncbi:MAG: hypothetical protein IPJ26_19600 [Bacteroidetes bacterium]|nr:hypothetical protein [Bacteroidota bacterium]
MEYIRSRHNIGFDVRGCCTFSLGATFKTIKSMVGQPVIAKVTVFDKPTNFYEFKWRSCKALGHFIKNLAKTC